MISENGPKVSVIIINYNSSSFTIQCVNSIIDLTKEIKNFEIIVVDNNSKAEDFVCLDAIQRTTKVKIIRSKINLGFSGGNMLGVQHAANDTSFYFFLNNDCVFIDDVISTLATFLLNNPSVGLVTGQMYSASMQRQASFGYYPSIGAILLGHSFMRIFDSVMYRSNKVEYPQPVSIPYATGSAMFVNAEYFAALGGFDTNYFLFCEEEDICMSLQKRGWGIYLVPEAKFIHYGGSSTQRNLAVDKEFYISYLYFMRKHYGYLSRAVLKLLYAIKLFRKLYKDVKFAKLSFFVLKNAPMKESLRFKQILSLSTSKESTSLS